MSKLSKVLIGCVVSLLVIVTVTVSLFASTHNQEVTLRNTIVNKQTDNKSEFDNMWKKISQLDLNFYREVRDYYVTTNTRITFLVC